ncbi:hypothetical protein PLESTB_000825700 [Pleodorina starrii]|uniref:Uncharacterized protein n=1 Tax=Pleodorina starrii TaxID=330485 RepID=A0A9W6F2V1_9CHLO|nr:hypothetical protein PLESTM_000141100 [Pleodorina starrii]GLC54119.1 hypothetical protein PLESTB_000825700 [Pleodorina starrii]GLC64578.1 hypothetical protein PLESTF_000180900 [Pleodorina starrii]
MCNNQAPSMIRPPSTDNDGERTSGTPLLQAAVRVAEQAAAHPAVQQVGAAALQLGTSCAAFNLTLAATHVTGGCLRIHCATPLLAPLWGAASVAAASVAAGHISRSTLAALRLSYRDHASGAGGGGGGGTVRTLAVAVADLPRQLWCSWDAREALVDALVGPFLFKVVFQQSFARLLPSHLAHPGAFGRLHIPTGPTEYSTAAEKAQLSVIFGRDGCHHCGTRVNGVIGDHMPPYKVVKDAMAAREAAGGLEKLLIRVADWLGVKDESLKQVYYSQCRACSGRQAQLMRNGTRVTALPGIWPPELVVHSPARLATRPAMAGMLVGMRYYVDATVRQGPSPGSYGSGGGDAVQGQGQGQGQPRGGGGGRWPWRQARCVREEGSKAVCRWGGEARGVLAGEGEADDGRGCDQSEGLLELFERRVVPLG